MKEEMKTAFLDNKFILAFGIMLICLFGLSLPQWVISADWGAEFRPSALQLAISPIFFGGIMLMLPFCASVPYATSQVDEIRTNFLFWKAFRSSTYRYAWKKITANALSGATAVAMAFAVHALIWNFIALPCDPVAYPYHELPFSDVSLYSGWYKALYGLPMYISMTVGIAICGGLWATLALAVSVWIPDKLLAVTIPAFIYYLWSSNFFRFLLGWNLPHPATLYNDALTLPMVWDALTVNAIWLLVAVVFYVCGLKRRIQHG